jgi:hypothetical protein
MTSLSLAIRFGGDWEYYLAVGTSSGGNTGFSMRWSDLRKWIHVGLISNYRNEVLQQTSVQEGVAFLVALQKSCGERSDQLSVKLLVKNAHLRIRLAHRWYPMRELAPHTFIMRVTGKWMIEWEGKHEHW